MADTDSLVAEAAERLFGDLCDPQAVNNARDEGWKDRLWQALAENGLIHASIPEELGGSGAGLSDGFELMRLAGRFAVPVPLAVAVTVNVAVPPLSRSTLSARFPEPLAAQLEPALATQVQLALESEAGKLSVTVAPVTALGPAFDATIVYVTVPFWFTPVTPSVLVIDRSAVTTTVVLAVALLFPATASVVALDTVAVLSIGSGAVYVDGTA